METVAAHALLLQRLRQGEGKVHLGHAGVEGRVEARDLWQLGKRRPELADTLQVVRLVQRRQRVEARQLRQHLVGHQHRPREHAAAMHHAVRDGLDVRCRLQAVHQGPQALQGTFKRRAASADCKRLRVLFS